MLESLSSKFSNAFNALRSRGKISEKDVEQTIAEIRTALLEADAALDVVNSFTTAVREKALALLHAGDEAARPQRGSDSEGGV